MIQSIVCGVVAALLLLGAVDVHGLLAWLLCVPLVVRLRADCSWQAAVVTGVAFGIAAAVILHLPWLSATAARYFGLAPGPAFAAAATLAVLCGATFGAPLGLALRAALSFRPAVAIVAVAAFWAAWEAWLVALPPYYPWVSLAATQVGMPALLQIAGLGGQAALSCTIAAAGAALGVAVAGRAWRTRAWAGLWLVLPAVLATSGWVRLANRPTLPSTCSVTTVDARVASSERGWRNTVERYALAMRGALPAATGAIIWPESALPGYPETNGALLRQLQALAHEWDAPLIAGGPRSQWSADWRRREFNSVYQIPARGPLQFYDKRHLVPFAEYWPAVLGSRPSWLPADDVSPGDRASVFTVPGCRLGVLVCFEADAPALARVLADAGADTVLVLSNDAQLAAAAVRNEVAQAQLRALETGLPVVRVANRGRSVVVDPYGRIVQRGAGVMHVTLPPPIKAPAVRWAPRFAVALWIAISAAGGAALWGQGTDSARQSFPKLSR
jgi:apolipoprotein N-acyltransferase